MWTIPFVLFFSVGQDAKNAPKVDEIVNAVRLDAIVMKSGKSVKLTTKNGPIANIWLSDAKVLKVGPSMSGGRAFLLKGLKPGIARLTLTDDRNLEDKLIVIVEE